ncbi:aminodeoxychorismate lyase [Thiohalorhabdus methylotrophus]|uniref:Aminodeoxychorismate lyase n=1 Tax=Thiohalorhabdus methylotrophus TaxID=3242694 RepID=A0ABV4TXN9_9GAMM
MSIPTNPSVLVNGRSVDPLEPAISVADRGFQYGDGLFETIAAREGRLLEGAAHLERLAEGARILCFPEPDTALLAAEAESLIAQQGAGERHVIKILLSRGPGGRGLLPPAEPEPTRAVMRLAWPGHPAEWGERGVRTISCATRQMSGDALDGRIKSMNQLNHIAARMEWSDPDIAEGLLRDHENRLIEGTVTNLFLVLEGTLLTPDLSGAGLPGITRRRVLELARAAGIPVREGVVRPQDLEEADEMFLTNSLVGIWPVRQHDARRLPRAPGPVTRQLSEALEATYA